MKEIYLISCFKRKLKKKNYKMGDKFSLPFKGVFNGLTVKGVDLEAGLAFEVPGDGATCLCSVVIINVEKNRILGKLESIDFL
jgi:hypothetical protein